MRGKVSEKNIVIADFASLENCKQCFTLVKNNIIVVCVLKNRISKMFTFLNILVVKLGGEYIIAIILKRACLLATETLKVISAADEVQQR